MDPTTVLVVASGLAGGILGALIHAIWADRTDLRMDEIPWGERRRRLDALIRDTNDVLKRTIEADGALRTDELRPVPAVWDAIPGPDRIFDATTDDDDEARHQLMRCEECAE